MLDQVEDRRKFLKQAGTVAWATPLILTLAAQRAEAQQTSCVPPGSQCGNWVEALGVCVTNGFICCGTCERLNQSMFCFCDGVPPPP